ncbi:peroxiredoxin family protein [Flavobacterium magnesitis]|uniref:peroxiredoxin family protein n=1 Tax=Flavobacterium magnesitis TaxID=3138077 RepID=UPI00358E2A1B
MKQTIITFFLFIISVLSYSQQPKMPANAVRIEPESIYSRLYNLQTGKKMTQEDFNFLIKEKGKVSFLPFFDKWGEIEKYYYNPNPTIRKNSGNDSPKVKKTFPDFVFTTSENKKIALEDLKGKLIIIHIGLIRNNQLINMDNILALESKIKASIKSSKIEALILFEDSKEDILKVLDIKKTTFTLIPNGLGFIKKWNTLMRPTTLIIDKKGKFLGEYMYNSEIDELLNK